MTQDGQRNKLHFNLQEIWAGRLEMKITKGTKNYTIFFDENLSDPVPAMIQMFVKIRDELDATWCINGTNRTQFEAFSRQGNEVELTIRSNYTHCGRDHWDITISDSFQRKDIMELFQKFFDDLLHHEDFPYQYPCYVDLDKAECTRLYKEATQYCRRLYGSNATEGIIRSYKKKYLREQGHLPPEGIEIYNKYKNMLIHYVIPEGWL
jgi:hypothetical protein